MHSFRFFLLTIGAAFLLTVGLSHPVYARSPRVEFRLVLPAPVYSQPELVLIPGTNVYYAPDTGEDIRFYQGSWWRLYDGYWYRAYSWHGPWRYVREVPEVIYDSRPPSPYSYHVYHRNWGWNNWSWGHDRHWDWDNWNDRDERHDHAERRDRDGWHHHAHENWHGHDHHGDHRDWDDH